MKNDPREKNKNIEKILRESYIVPTSDFGGNVNGDVNVARLNFQTMTSSQLLTTEFF